MTPALLLKTGHAQRLLDDTFAGTIAHGGEDYPACIGAFMVEQRLSPDGGGFTPVTTGKVQVAKSDAIGATFKSTQNCTVTPKSGGAVRQCKIDFVEDIQVAWVLTLRDLRQGA